MHLSFEFETMAGAVVVTRPLMTCDVSKRNMWIGSRLSTTVNTGCTKSFAKQRPQNAAEIKIFTQPLLTQAPLCLDGGITFLQENKLMSNHKNNKGLIIIR